jgi:hypothetical protein
MGDESERRTGIFRKVAGKATAVLRADRDMQKVLDCLAGLDPDAIEKCTVEEARRQPTDAVRLVLVRQCHEPLPAVLIPDVRTRDEVVPGATGPLRARADR